MFRYVHSFVLQSGLALVHEMDVYILLRLICFYFSRLQQVHSIVISVFNISRIRYTVLRLVSKRGFGIFLCLHQYLAYHDIVLYCPHITTKKKEKEKEKPVEPNPSRWILDISISFLPSSLAHPL